MSREIPIMEMASRFRKVTHAATVYDVLDNMGYPHQCLNLAIRPLTDNMVVAGPAFTVRGNREPRRGSEMKLPKFEDFGMYRAMYSPCVVVVNACGLEHIGCWGEFMSWSSKQHGATGVVIDGGIRDRMQLLQIPDWPVFAKFTSPIESNQRFRLDDFEVPIVMTGTLATQVRVDPGDWILGDADGVMVIPKSIATEVLVKAEEMEQREENQRRAVAKGMPIEEAHKKFGRM